MVVFLSFFGFGILNGVPGSLYSEILTAFHDVKYIAIATIFGNIFLLIGFVFLFKAGYGTVLNVFLASSIVGFFFLVALVFRIKAKHSLIEKTQDTSTEIRFSTFLKYSFPFMLNLVMNFIVWRQSEVFFLSHYRSPEEVGQFDVAYTFSQQIIQFVPFVVASITMTGLSELYVVNREKFYRGIEIYLKFIALIVAPLSVGGLLLGADYVLLLYGESMSEASEIVGIFFVIFSITLFTIPLSQLLYVQNKTWWMTLSYFIFSLLNIALDVILIPKYGIIGAVFAVSIIVISSCAIFILLMIKFYEHVKLPWVFIFKCYLCTVPFVIVKLSIAINFLVLTLFCIVLYAGSLKISRVLKKEEFSEVIGHSKILDRIFSYLA